MKQRPSSIVKLVMSAAVLAVMLGLSGPVGNILAAYVEPVPSVWRIGSRLIMLLSGLMLVSVLIQLLLDRWAPATGHAELKTSRYRKNVIFIASELLIPESMQKEVTILDMPLPTLDEIKAKLNKMITQNNQIDTSDLNEDGKERLCKAAQGLTLQEAENAFALAMVNDGKIDGKDLGIILSEKMQVIKKTGILEFINTDIKISDVGGLENLKNWLNKRNNSWSESAIV